MQEVAKAIEAFYAKEYPSLDKALVKAGADTAAEVYGRIQFPEMKTNWETHPNHIGHPDPSTDQGFPGCWRCHDDELTTADGEAHDPAGLRQLPHLPGRGQPDPAGVRQQVTSGDDRARGPPRALFAFRTPSRP